MRKFFFAVALLLGLSANSFADTNTPRLGLLLISTGSSNWGIKLNNSVFSVIDSSVAALNQPNTFNSSNTFKLPVLLQGTSAQLTGPNGYVVSESSITGSHFGNGSALSKTYNVAIASTTAVFATTSASLVVVPGSTATLTNVVSGNRVRVCGAITGSNGTNGQTVVVALGISGQAAENICSNNSLSGTFVNCSRCIVSASTSGGTVTANLQVSTSGGTYTKTTAVAAYVMIEEIK